MSIREKIIQYLEENNRKTIKEIAEAIQEQENVVRTKIFDKKYGLLKKNVVAKVSHEQRKGYFSLAKNYIDPMKLLKFYNEFFKENYKYLAKNEKITNKITQNKEIFDNIEKVVNNT